MTTQDTGLVEVAARALYERMHDVRWSEASAMDHDLFGECSRAVLTALLPHLSPESRKIIEDELKAKARTT